jgi:hypothetical protein
MSPHDTYDALLCIVAFMGVLCVLGAIADEIAERRAGR